MPRNIRSSPPPPSEPSLDGYLSPPRSTVLHIAPLTPVHTSLSFSSRPESGRSERWSKVGEESARGRVGVLPPPALHPCAPTGVLEGVIGAGCDCGTRGCGVRERGSRDRSAVEIWLFFPAKGDDYAGVRHKRGHRWLGSRAVRGRGVAHSGRQDILSIDIAVSGPQRLGLAEEGLLGSRHGARRKFARRGFAGQGAGAG